MRGLPLSCLQVEFGAHQVVLVRSMDSVERLPEGLRDSNALVLTVPQVGGLQCCIKGAEWADFSNDRALQSLPSCELHACPPGASCRVLC